MSAIALIEAAAPLLWVYTALTFVAWLNHLLRRDKSGHVAMGAELLSRLVPAMIGLVVVVLAGAFIGLPSAVAFIALLFPAGTAYGTHMALSEAQDGHPSSILPRLVATLLAGLIIITLRQIL